jgi:tRNA uridine 5-carboxymethylaminomethyl modification enzyme
LDYASISGLSRELSLKLAAAQPKTMAQAARIDGMTPAALVLLLARLHRQNKRAQA